MTDMRSVAELLRWVRKYRSATILWNDADASCNYDGMYLHASRLVALHEEAIERWGYEIYLLLACITSKYTPAQYHELEART